MIFTSLLAGTVILTNIGKQLEDIGYTTAIEYGFYVFFGLCLFCIVVALHSERLALKEQRTAVKRLCLVAGGVCAGYGCHHRSVYDPLRAAHRLRRQLQNPWQSVCYV